MEAPPTRSTDRWKYVTPAARDRRRAVRYPCLARVRTDTRDGMTVDISADGLSFRTMDRFIPDEHVELCLAFELSREPTLQVVHAATVVWATPPGEGRPARVGVKFLN